MQCLRCCRSSEQRCSSPAKVRHSAGFFLHEPKICTLAGMCAPTLVSVNPHGMQSVVLQSDMEVCCRASSVASLSSEAHAHQDLLVIRGLETYRNLWPVVLLLSVCSISIRRASSRNCMLALGIRLKCCLQLNSVCISIKPSTHGAGSTCAPCL